MQEHLSRLAAHGLTQDDIWDIGAVVALFALSNRMAFLTSMKPNQEFYLMGRVKKEKQWHVDRVKRLGVGLCIKDSKYNKT